MNMDVVTVHFMGPTQGQAEQRLGEKPVSGWSTRLKKRALWAGERGVRSLVCSALSLFISSPALRPASVVKQLYCGVTSAAGTKTPEVKPLPVKRGPFVWRVGGSPHCLFVSFYVLRTHSHRTVRWRKELKLSESRVSDQKDRGEGTLRSGVGAVPCTEGRSELVRS